MRFASLAFFLMLLAIVGQAGASPIAFESVPTGEIGTPSGLDPAFVYYYHDVSGNSATAELAGVPVGSDTFLITSGTLNVTSGLDIGTFLLFSTGPDVTLSPAGAFLVNNVLYYGNDPALDNWGLLFRGNGLEINIWGNGSNNYSFWSHNGAGYNVSYDGGSFEGGLEALTSSVPETDSPVPEPSTLYLLSGGIAVLCAYRMVRVRQPDGRKRV